jgi:hypothetical protein
MAEKIMSNRPGDRMEGLGEVLQLSPEQYAEGIFCWKGFLYFKWTLGTMGPDLVNFISSVASIKPVGPTDGGSREYLVRGRALVRERIKEALAETRQTMKLYNEAYAGLTQQGKPEIFRDFLLGAPRMFNRLGDQLGAVQHVISFWNFRFGPKSEAPTVTELIDIFMDFEASLKRQS